MIEFGGHWDTFLSFCEFSYNNSYHSNIDMSLFEELYGRVCTTIIGWLEAGDVKHLGIYLIKDSHYKVGRIQDKILAAQP